MDFINYPRQSGFCDRCHPYCTEIYTLSGYLCRDGLESFWVWSLVLAFGNRSHLVCVLFLDLPSLHVSHFGTKCFYTCISTTGKVARDS